MPNAIIWHLVLSGIIVAELLVLLLLRQPAPDGPKENASSPRPPYHRAIEADGGTPDTRSMEIASLEAEMRALEAQIHELHDASTRSDDRVPVDREFIAKRRFGRISNPIESAGETLELLQITEEEARLIEAATSEALERVRSIESALVGHETLADGRRRFVVAPWPERGSPVMDSFQSDLAASIGAPRAAILFEEIRDGKFARGGTVGLQITPVLRDSPETPFSIGDPEASMRFDVTVTDAETGGSINTVPIWLTEENTPEFLNRFGHVLGVESASELEPLFELNETQ
ncbi:MAG: hypothetical protein ACR2RV_12040 [Verrucomicrobiales bacterium]